MAQDTHIHLPAVDLTDDLVTKDSGGNNAVRVSGDLNLVSLPSDGETLVNSYDEISSLVKDTTMTIVSYVAPIGKTSYLQFVEAGGANIATFQVEIQGNIEAKKRTYFSGPLSTEFQFYSTAEAGIELNAGDVVRVRVEHGRPMVADFEARIQILEIG